MSEMTDLPHNLQQCDREIGGCGTPFSITLDQCPNCQRPVDGDSRPGEKPTNTEEYPPVSNEISRSDDAPPETTEQQPAENETTDLDQPNELSSKQQRRSARIRTVELPD